MADSVHRDNLVTKALAGSFNGGSVRQQATVITADATATAILTVPLAQLEAIAISGYVIGVKSDLSAGIFRTVTCGFRRASGGNVTSIGTASGTDVEDSAGTPAVTVIADTSAQTAIVKVTGIAAETWHWEFSYAYTKIA